MAEQTLPQSEVHLTETILTLHHEVQSAIDYIDQVSRHEATELGKSELLMAVDHIKIRLPICFEIEQNSLHVREIPEKPSIDDIKKFLATRQGFQIGADKPLTVALFNKVRVDLEVKEISKNKQTPITESAAKEDKPTALGSEKVTGELEITFVPVNRH